MIATPQALEGISAVAGTEVLRASDAGEFVFHVGAELTAPSGLGTAARRRILRDYRWDANLQRLGAALGVDEADPLPEIVPAAHRDRSCEVHQFDHFDHFTDSIAERTS